MIIVSDPKRECTHGCGTFRNDAEMFAHISMTGHPCASSVIHSSTLPVTADGKTKGRTGKARRLSLTRYYQASGMNGIEAATRAITEEQQERAHRMNQKKTRKMVAKAMDRSRDGLTAWTRPIRKGKV